MNLLVIGGDDEITLGEKTPYYYVSKEFSKYWDSIFVICRNRSGRGREATIHSNVHFCPVKSSPLFLFSWNIYKKGVEICQNNKIDLITTLTGAPFYDATGAWLLWKRFKTPYILEIHHVVGYPRAADIKETLARILMRFYIRIAWKSARAIRVVNSKEVLEFLIKQGVPREKIEVISSAYLNLNVFKPIKTEKTGRKIAYCGRLARNKGLFELLKAIKIVRDKYPDIRLTIVGKGPLKREAKDFVKSQGLSKNVIFKGWVPEIEEIVKIYNESEMLVMTSYSEGNPRVTLEAMACGTPVISTKVGIMKELIKHGENGLLVDWDPRDIAEKIIFLLENKELREKMGERGRKTVKKFEFKKMIKNYADVYRRLASPR